ncbi:MAG: AGE family epimerase/isomerase [Propionibacteriaceae bacterium]|nr:AGE family epimerase/isomerase [Propionibacteriaceae bacterium]
MPLTIGSRSWRLAQAAGLLDFALHSIDPRGGFGWLDEVGHLDPNHPRELWISCRMTHVMAIGQLLGHAGCADGLDHGMAALAGLFHDDENGGWFSAVDASGAPIDTDKAAYPHAFVILAAASALAAGHPGGRQLLDQALRVSQQHFWDEVAGRVVEQWDWRFTQVDPYRGVNANMHSVEAYLAAADALELTGDQAAAGLWRGRARRIIDALIIGNAATNTWRIPEHFDAEWQPLLEYNRDRPDDPFRPYGATVGHGLEWARLCLQADPTNGPGRPDYRQAALALYQRAIADGWCVDGADGFVYTTDWQGQPVVRQRMHWVLAEAIGASGALRQAGLISDGSLPMPVSNPGQESAITTDQEPVDPDDGRAKDDSLPADGGANVSSVSTDDPNTDSRPPYPPMTQPGANGTADLDRWWHYADHYLIDHERGSWHHELNPNNQPAATVWQGKPDVYHALQACLLEDLPRQQGIVTAIARRRASALA